MTKACGEAGREPGTNTEHQSQPECEVLTLAGRLDAKDAPQLRETLLSRSRDHAGVVVDCGNVTSIDLPCIQVLLSAASPQRATALTVRGLTPEAVAPFTVGDLVDAN